MMSKYRNAGQTSSAPTASSCRTRVYDKFADKLAEAVRKLKVGDGTEQGVTRARSSTRPPSPEVQEHIDDAVKKGGKVRRRRQVARRQLLRADADPRRDAGHGGRPRGNLRPRRSALPLHDGRKRSRWPTTPSSALPATLFA